MKFSASDYDSGLVSVVVTTYKRPISVVGRAIGSVLRQSYQEWELILINDSPETPELSRELERYVDSLGDKRIRYVETPCNVGGCKARNLGASLARGEFLAYLDDDDEWLPEKIETQVSMVDDSSKVITCSCYIESEQGKWGIQEFDEASCTFHYSLCGNGLGSTSLPLIGHELFDDAGGFDESVTFGQEFELWIRLLMRTNAKRADVPLVKYHYSADSTFHSAKDKFFQSTCYVLDKHAKLYELDQSAKCEFLNRAAVSSLVEFRDISMYRSFKKAALDVRILDGANLIECRKAIGKFVGLCGKAFECFHSMRASVYKRDHPLERREPFM